MCGFVLQIARDYPVDSAVFDDMVDSLAHRGPDDRGTEFFEGHRVALGHRRLSILDLSSAGRQPMEDATGRFRILYNGEIYNFAALRQRLEALGHVFRSRTDTEVLLNAYIRWGKDALPMLDGIFAFAVYDTLTGELFLARDRFGVKPLYYVHRHGELLAASEPKALLLSGRLDRQVRPEALADYLLFGYVTEDHGIWRSLSKVPPGGWIRFKDGRLQTGEYLGNLREEEAPSRREIGSEELDERFGDALVRTVTAQNVSDVEVGLFLSGGLDSSSVALAQHLAGQPLRAFTVDFEDKPNNEVESARKVADRLGLDLHVCKVVASDMKSVDQLQRHFDEPFADASLLPTFLISRFAREHGIKVALSGDGGDEIHAGYVWYGQCQEALQGVAPRDRGRVIRRRYGYYPYQFYLREELSAWLAPEFREVMDERATAFFRHVDTATGDDLKAAQMLDVKTYLPGDILTKVDRASMAVGLEVRVPLLGNEVTDMVMREHSTRYADRQEGKQLLRRFLKGRVPDEILRRPKQGFSIPLRPYMLKTNYRERVMDAGLEKLGAFSRGALEKEIHADFETHATRHILLYLLAVWSDTWLAN